jgi:hypothetical protein
MEELTASGVFRREIYEPGKGFDCSMQWCLLLRRLERLPQKVCIIQLSYLHQPLRAESESRMEKLTERSAVRERQAN